MPNQKIKFTGTHIQWGDVLSFIDIFAPGVKPMIRQATLGKSPCSIVIEGDLLQKFTEGMTIMNCLHTFQQEAAE